MSCVFYIALTFFLEIGFKEDEKSGGKTWMRSIFLCKVDEIR